MMTDKKLSHKDPITGPSVLAKIEISFYLCTAKTAEVICGTRVHLLVEV